jgi:hypothetical protein
MHLEAPGFILSSFSEPIIFYLAYYLTSVPVSWWTSSLERKRGDMIYRPPIYTCHSKGTQSVPNLLLLLLLLGSQRIPTQNEEKFASRRLILRFRYGLG